MLELKHKPIVESAPDQIQEQVPETRGEQSLYGTFFAVLCILGVIVVSWAFVFNLFQTRL